MAVFWTVIGEMATRHSVPASRARAVYEQMDLPANWPAFQSISMDRLGWIWAELFRPLPDETSRWMIFDPDGMARGTIEPPPDLEIHDIGADYVLGRWLDDSRISWRRAHLAGQGGFASHSQCSVSSTAIDGFVRIEGEDQAGLARLVRCCAPRPSSILRQPEGIPRVVLVPLRYGEEERRRTA